MMPHIDWPTLTAITTVMAAGGTAALLILRAQLTRYFVTRAEHGDMSDRVERIERKLVEVPTHEDMKAIIERLALGQGKFDGLAQGIDDLKRAVGRVEKQVDMVIQSQLEREARS